MLHITRRIISVVLFFVIMASNGLPLFAQTYKFAQLGGSPMSTVGWNLQGAAKVGNTGANTANAELLLTPAQRSQSGAVFYNTAINLAACNKWIAEFDFRIAEGSGADGLAFCYLDVPPTGFVLGEGIGIPGVANGLKVAIDTWWNCGGDQHPKLQIRYGFGYKECDSTMPTLNNNNGALSFIRNGNYHHCQIRYDHGNIVVAINGTDMLSGFQTFNFKGYFGFTAATGNSYDVHSIKNVVIYTDMPPSEAGLGSTICSGGTAQLGIPSPGDPSHRYNWSPIAGLNNSTVHNPLATLTNDGPAKLIQKFYVFTEFSYNPGCASVDSVEVVVNPTPKVTYNAAGVCHRDTTKITPVTNWPDSLVSTVNWVWSYNDPLALPANNTSTGLVGNHLYANSGIYNVGLVATTREGCVKSYNAPIEIRKLPTVGFATINPTNLCFNQNVKFVQLVNAGNKGATAIYPDFETGNPVINYTQLVKLGDTVSVNYKYAGVTPDKPYYLVKWINTDSSGCSAAATDTVRFKTQPKPTLAALAAVCYGVAPFQITGFGETSGIAGVGTFTGRGVVAPTGLFSANAAGVGTHLIRYIYAAYNGCTDTASQNQVVNALPVVNAGPDKFILPGGYAVLNGSSTVAASSVQWTPATSLSNASIYNPQARPAADQVYTLRVATAQGCSGIDSALVKVLPYLTIPNAFSPHHNDGINDTWIIKNLELFPESKIGVYDRYGRVVHNATGYASPWDGKINGILVPVGVYYYIIDPKNGEKIYAGSIHIL